MRIVEHAPSTSQVNLALRALGAGWRRYKGWRVSRRLENRVTILLQEFRIYVDALDSGQAHFVLHLSNFSGSDIVLKHVELHHWYLANRALTQIHALLQAKGSAEAGRPGNGTFSVSLTSADIRTIVLGIEPAQNLRSAPAARLEAVGICVFTVKGREARVPLTILREGTRITLPTHVIEQIVGARQ